MTPKFTRLEIAGMLAETIGQEKAQQVVDAAARDLGLLSSFIKQDEAKQVLGKIAETPGLVGMTATFAKSRLHFTAASHRLKSTGN